MVFDLRIKTCSNSKCYSDLCASSKTRGAVVDVGADAPRQLNFILATSDIAIE
ncbi:hypothetical protein GFB56_21860 [Ensifer sp. T173]|uniref:Uncharacterized protein n=1 Tax=Ensifer canadensis TaxID=555315 RepID=A0AAW4FQ00_9HYPH|nr:hypothetical protein [Ensifer canadensis]